MRRENYPRDYYVTIYRSRETVKELTEGRIDRMILAWYHDTMGEDPTMCIKYEERSELKLIITI